MRKNKFIFFLIVIISLTFIGCIGNSVQTYSIVGMVMDSDGQPMNGIRVDAIFDGKKESVLTDLSGKYSFSGLKGKGEIKVEEQAGLRCVPKKWQVAKAADKLDFTLHVIQEYAVEAIIPLSGQLAYEELLLDFSKTNLGAGAKVTVQKAEQPPLGEMVKVGPVLDFQLPAELDGVVQVSFDTATSDAWIFHYNESEQVWDPVIMANYEGGELKVDLSDFSTYGVFTAPRSPKPTVNPSPGKYGVGTQIRLTGNQVYYTVDNSLFTNSSALYVQPFILKDQDLVIRAVNLETNKKPSEIAEFVYEVDRDQELKYISGPRFATILGHLGRYFNFETGETLSDRENADLRLSTTIYAGEHFLFSFHETNAIKFDAPQVDGNADFENHFQFFRSVSAADWDEDAAVRVTTTLSAYDTLLIKTRQGRLVKVMIIQTRGVWQDVDRKLGRDIPEVDLVYLYLDEVDLDPPILESISFDLDDGTKIDFPVAESIDRGVMDVILPTQPENIHFNFNEVVYKNRTLMQTYEIPGFPPHHTFMELYARPSSKLGPNDLSVLFSGHTRFMGYGSAGYAEFSAGDDEFWQSIENQYFVDQGFYFSDVMGNRWTELPFDKLIIRVK